MFNKQNIINLYSVCLFILIFFALMYVIVFNVMSSAFSTRDPKIEDLAPSQRIVSLQNSLIYTKKGFYTDSRKPKTQEITYENKQIQAFPLSYALAFLKDGINGTIQVFTTDNEEITIKAEDLANMFVILNNPEDALPPVLYSPSTKISIKNFRYLRTPHKEIIFSHLANEKRSMISLFELAGWETKIPSRIVSTDKFYLQLSAELTFTTELMSNSTGNLISVSEERNFKGKGRLHNLLYIENLSK